MQVRIVESGMAKALKATDVYGQGAKAAHGPIAAWSSRLVYALPVERRWRTGSGGARMFEKGVAETATQVPAIMGPAIVRGPSAVGGARRQIQNLGQTNIRKYTPVKTGALRDSIEIVQRPRSA